MIIIGADDHAKLDPPFHGPTIRFPEEAAVRSLPSLPDYDTSQQEHAGLLNQKDRHRRWGWMFERNFLRAFLLALAVYIALSLIVCIPLVVVVSRFMGFKKSLRRDLLTVG